MLGCRENLAPTPLPKFDPHYATSVLLKKRTHAPNHKITAGSEARRLLLEAVACYCLVAASRAAERLCREVTRRNI